MKVSKFGGSSVATAGQIRKVFDIIMSDRDRKVVVVSAPGKRNEHDVKTTDLLIALATNYLQDRNIEREYEAVISRYRDIAEELELGDAIIHEIDKDIQARLTLDEINTDRFIDRLKAAGEDNNAKLIAAYFRKRDVTAEYVNPGEAGLIVSDEVGNAQVLSQSYERLYKLRKKQGVVIFPGFFGYSPEGHLVTFPRGGSDISGAILAAALQADLYENFTDVDSVYSVNPAIVNNPKEIRELTYKEMRELSYAGFGVFHEEALAPAFRASIPVCIKNTNNPSAPGTMIVAKRKLHGNPVVGIAGDKGFMNIYVEKYLMNREVGFGRKLLQVFEEEGLSYEHTPSGIDSINVILRAEQLTEAKEVQLLNRIKTELSVDKVKVERDIALIMIVGEGMHEAIGVAAKAVTAIQSADVNIAMINQGSSEVSMMFGVNEKDVEKAVKNIYEAFFHKQASEKQFEAIK